MHSHSFLMNGDSPDTATYGTCSKLKWKVGCLQYWHKSGLILFVRNQLLNWNISLETNIWKIWRTAV
jgi:hypothetical protein